jgi:arsenate reductase (thioredoxin)
MQVSSQRLRALAKVDGKHHSGVPVVTMGCGDACPIFPGRHYEDWDVDDPARKNVADVRPIRDEIERRVHQLLTSLGVPARA